MKTIKFLLACVLIVNLSSCSKKNDDPDIDIVGEWRMTEGFVEPASIVLDMGGMQIPVEVSGNFVEIDDQNRLSFHENNTFSSVTGNIALELDLNIMGTLQTDRFEADELFGQGTWELNGRDLKIHNENGTSIPYHIDAISENEMELSSNVSEMTMEGGTNPILEGMDITIKMKLKRI